MSLLHHNCMGKELSDTCTLKWSQSCSQLIAEIDSEIAATFDKIWLVICAAII